MNQSQSLTASAFQYLASFPDALQHLRHSCKLSGSFAFIIGLFFAGCLMSSRRSASIQDASPGFCQMATPSASVIFLVQSRLLHRQHITRLEPEHSYLRQRWAYLLKLCHHHRRTASWVDPDLPILRGISHLARLSPSYSLQLLVREPQQLQEPFSGFGPSLTADHGK